MAFGTECSLCLPREAKNCTVLFFAIALPKLHLLRQFLAHKFPIIRVPVYSIFLCNQRQGTSLSFKSTAAHRTVHIQQSCSFVARCQTSIIEHNLWLPITSQTSLRELQNLGSAIGANLLKLYTRYWWVEATSEWQLVKHLADGHWSNYWSVTI